MNREFHSLTEDEQFALAANRRTLGLLDREEIMSARPGHSSQELSVGLPHLSGFWTFVGDIHGRLQDLPKPGHPVVQVGDMGIGFIRADEDARFIRSRDDLWFIRGNHDNPFLCQNHPRHLGDWGRHEFMFWVSGAWSIDQNFRVEGVSWWREEELSTAQGRDAYVTAKPRLMVTHDAPSSLFIDHGPMELGGFRPSATATLLQSKFRSPSARNLAVRPSPREPGLHHRLHPLPLPRLLREPCLVRRERSHVPRMIDHMISPTPQRIPRSAQRFLVLRQPAAAFHRQPAAVERQTAPLRQTASATAKPQTPSRIFSPPTPAGWLEKAAAGCRSTKRSAPPNAAPSQSTRQAVGRVCAAREMPFLQPRASQHRPAGVAIERVKTSDTTHSRAGSRHTRPTSEHSSKVSTKH